MRPLCKKLTTQRMNKIVCFGELLLRLSPDINGEWIQSAAMPVYVGGAELNVATALANWQMPVKYITALPDNLLSQHLHVYLRQKGIDDSGIYQAGNRIGAYYMPQGSDLKHAAVIYDRAHSSFAQLQPGMIDWNNVLQNADWFHFSAITPALNETLALVCKEAVEAATKKGIMISVDLNYRAKLWQYGRKPYEIMPGLVAHCDVIMGNLWSAESLLNIAVDTDIHAKGTKENYLHHASQTAGEIRRQFRQCTIVAQTFRFDEENGIRYYGAVDAGNTQHVSPEFCSKKTADKAGSGDCFMAGLIYGLRQPYSLQQTVDFAAAAAFGKLHETGDSTKQMIADIENILNRFVCK